MTRAAAQKIQTALKSARRILISSHRDPDGDSLGCQLAFYEYWTRQRRRRADIVNQGPVPRKYRFLSHSGVVREPGALKRRPRWDAAIIFECSSLDRIGTVSELLPDGLPVINIDHHQHNSRYGAVNVLDPTAAACGEMVFDMLRHWKATITPSMAQSLATALVTDTGRFGHPCTNLRTMVIAAELVKRGADLPRVTAAVYQSYSPAEFRLVHHILGRADLRADSRICFLALRTADRRRYQVPMHELEGLVDHTLSVAGVQVGALLRELGPKRTKASLRSCGTVDVAALARRFGGGGHRNAAGCIIELPLAKAADTLERAIGPLRDNHRPKSKS
ncbi:MAG TPA: bifunctional oligoribonuclease/PAP phosphatase NrnA [candidate division Zixibacteria bacterium]|jgi:phosphoesterase RecJ-like protein